MDMMPTSLQSSPAPRLRRRSSGWSSLPGPLPNGSQTNARRPARPPPRSCHPHRDHAASCWRWSHRASRELLITRQCRGRQCCQGQARPGRPSATGGSKSRVSQVQTRRAPYITSYDGARRRHGSNARGRHAAWRVLARRSLIGKKEKSHHGRRWPRMIIGEKVMRAVGGRGGQQGGRSIEVSHARRARRQAARDENEEEEEEEV
mmetsp:Transcript_8115/g.25027  ORF Transcript_8115/g.25027 Transcript_8115/m.25027 type:complete len:205 (+) Transcript_8115:534-1148(+)